MLKNNFFYTFNIYWAFLSLTTFLPHHLAITGTGNSHSNISDMSGYDELTELTVLTRNNLNKIFEELNKNIEDDEVYSKLLIIANKVDKILINVEHLIENDASPEELKKSITELEELNIRGDREKYTEFMQLYRNKDKFNIISKIHVILITFNYDIIINIIDKENNNNCFSKPPLLLTIRVLLI